MLLQTKLIFIALLVPFIATYHLDASPKPFNHGEVFTKKGVQNPHEDFTQAFKPKVTVPSQACARCHLWSRGRGYRNAGEFENVDGTYRADGCAACHVLYSNQGLYEGDDPAIDQTKTLSLEFTDRIERLLAAD